MKLCIGGILVVKVMVKRAFGKVKECLNGGGLFAKIWEPFGILNESLQEVVVIFTCLVDFG